MSLVLAVPRPLVATSAAGGSEGDKPTEKEQQDGKSKHIKPKRKAETHEDDRNAKAIKDGKDDGKAKKSLSQDRILPWVWVTGVYIGIFNLFYFDILTLVVPSNLDFKYVIYIHITYSSKGLGPIDLERIPSSLSQLLLSRRCWSKRHRLWKASISEDFCHHPFLRRAESLEIWTLNSMRQQTLRLLFQIVCMSFIAASILGW